MKHRSSERIILLPQSKFCGEKKTTWRALGIYPPCQVPKTQCIVVEPEEEDILNVYKV